MNFEIWWKVIITRRKVGCKIIVRRKMNETAKMMVELDSLIFCSVTPGRFFDIRFAKRKV
jgi:hypothetical protein